MLVEEAGIEVEDLLADEVEAEVPGLDDSRVDRADGDLVRIRTLDRHRPAREVEIVMHERPQRLVAVEPDSVQVMSLALVPAAAGTRSTIDGTAPSVTSTVSTSIVPSFRANTARTGPAAATAYRPANVRSPSSKACTLSR